MKFDELYDIAKNALNPRKISKNSYAGSVAAAILSESGKVYTGVCIDTPCSMGFCAEHAAIATMITAGENRITKIVAVYEDGTIIPPCGRCREFICQIHDENYKCQVMIKKDMIITINDLLPYRWE
ncbi:cytidine deaminase [Clostridium botulinum]|uniref:cytidine deaminase family protein n=1 Tax=Clostridium botulinum TaxID=1491 RepID=UPI0001F851D1|nr:cytidine deaminase [Clostridium botulinum]NFB17588.1 cytidine deaminase [Clostridium botulinum]NFB66651.1 cytidine deaminase [Clostridium botulinum]NFB97872.1 cytidine deaminase [Clostridium botulinum]NFC46711.1 cytidine deaminase [Clostridium botulinum]NFC57008.1 cytidine deaminase [Clostridium botulinum]